MPYQGVVLGVLVGVALAVAAVFYAKSQGNSSHSNRSHNNGGPSHTEHVPSWELCSNRNSKAKRKRSVQAENTVCTVCYDELNGDLKTLSCQHKFHVVCIGRWLREKQSCPVCRQSATM